MKYRAKAPLTIRAGERSRNIAIGEVVEFGDVIVPARAATAALTLGACVDPNHFDPVETPSSSAGARIGAEVTTGPIGASPDGGVGAIASALLAKQES